MTRNLIGCCSHRDARRTCNVGERIYITTRVSRFSLAPTTMTLSFFPCLSANPDVAGIGVRTAMYAQNLLSFIPAFYALLDGKVTFDELDSIETQAMTILITALALLLSAVIEAVTQDLSAIHAAIILNLSWMNNTNLFIYLLLYIHHKAGVEETKKDDRWHWTFWWRVTRNVVSWGNLSTQAGEARPRRFVIYLGTLHLSLMAVVGIWLWVHPSTFGHRPFSSCPISPSLTVIGFEVPITSSALRLVSFLMYSLVLLPMFNIIIPSALVLLFYTRFNRAHKTMPPRTSKLYPVISLSCFQNPWQRSSGGSSSQHRIFPISICLILLAVVNVIFLVDTELTVHRNRRLQDGNEDSWSFGQTLSLLLLLIPLRDLVEGLQKRQEKKQEERMLHSIQNSHEATQAFQKALEKRYLWRTKEYIERGANIDLQNEDGSSALMIAVQGSNMVIIHYLVKKNANMNLHDAHGNTALILATGQGKVEIVRYLIDKGSNVNLQNVDGFSALMIAVRGGNTEIMQYLADHGADMNQQNAIGRSALMLAAQKSRLEITRHLVSKGADLNLQDVDGHSALMLAARKGKVKIAQHLVFKGANMNLQDTFGYSALMFAVEEGNWETMQHLVDKGADMNLQNSYGRSALILAGQKGKLKTMDYLVSKGADVNLRDPYDNSPLILAIQNGHTEFAKYLVSKGADINLTDLNGQSPQMLARKMGNDDLVKYLTDFVTKPKRRSSTRSPERTNSTRSRERARSTRSPERTKQEY
ncbi:ankyrin repeat-containing domain protein [Flagelloscypha sp. PMI_526]|nr:ankyrin repeat-containing domain protein [Flagelloscypha sp. PMI_526]